jgi:iron(III) transport system permease protein
VSIGGQTALALARALAIGVVAVAVSGPLRTWLAAQRGRVHVFAWALLLAPVFTPPLLISYAFSRFALALVASPWSHEALYLAILALKLIPVAVIVRVLFPPPLSAEALHIHRMLTSPASFQRRRFAVRGAGAGPWIAAGIVFLLVFSDFELASLWSVRTWTVALFDAQTGGLALRESLRLVAWPLAVEVTLLGLLFRAALRVPTRRDSMPRQVPRVAGRLPWLYLTSTAVLVCLLPLAIVTREAAAGLPALAENFILARQLGASLFFAAGAAITADALTRLGRVRLPSALLLGAPGLLGALAVSLVTLALFQSPPLRPIYDTPLPLLLALTILLLPLALLLAALRAGPAPAAHLARQFGSRRLIWVMETRPHAVALGLLFCWAWFDFTASSILAPVGLTPVFVRLHNLAHYGQTSALSAMMLSAFAAPVFMLLAAGATARGLAGSMRGAFRS